MFYKDERLALFIDGANLYSTAKTLGFDIDYRLLRNEFMRRGKLVRAHYYALLPGPDEYSPIRPLLDFLHYNGFSVITKTIKEYLDGPSGRKVKGNMEVELTIDAFRLAGHMDHAVLFTGNGDYLPLVTALQQAGVRVSVVSSIKTTPPMVSDELRRQADNFIDIDDLKDIIARPPRVTAVEQPLARSA